MLGLNEHFDSHADKMNAYYAYLFPSAETSTSGCLPDDDIVVFLDAYDVVLLPHIANVDRVMAQSETPILYCAEAGIYPEYSGTCSVCAILLQSCFTHK